MHTTTTTTTHIVVVVSSSSSSAAVGSLRSEEGFYSTEEHKSKAFSTIADAIGRKIIQETSNHRFDDIWSRHFGVFDDNIRPGKKWTKDWMRY